ncbi:hypothetical protein EC991_000318 [Linnemannia zychae]|nr:hypothetical protein EC991_000318 [Linnemannia zychae]
MTMKMEAFEESEEFKSITSSPEPLSVYLSGSGSGGVRKSSLRRMAGDDVYSKEGADPQENLVVKPVSTLAAVSSDTGQIANRGAGGGGGGGTDGDKRDEDGALELGVMLSADRDDESIDDDGCPLEACCVFSVPDWETVKAGLLPTSKPARDALMATIVLALITITLEAVLLYRHKAMTISWTGSTVATSGMSYEISFFRPLTVYYYIFILAEVFAVGLLWDAAIHKNSMQLVAFTLFEWCMVTYSGLQIWQHDQLVKGIGMPAEVLVELGCKTTQMILFSQLGVQLAACLGITLLTWRLYSEFGWLVFQKLGADVSLRIAALTDKQWQKGLAEIAFAIPLSGIIILLGFCALRNENKVTMGGFISCLGLLIAYMIYRLVALYQTLTGNPSTDPYFFARKTMTVFAALTLFVTVLALVYAVVMLYNFNKGLKEAMQQYRVRRSGTIRSVTPSTRRTSVNGGLQYTHGLVGLGGTGYAGEIGIGSAGKRTSSHHSGGINGLIGLGSGFGMSCGGGSNGSGGGIVTNDGRQRRHSRFWPWTLTGFLVLLSLQPRLQELIRYEFSVQPSTLQLFSSSTCDINLSELNSRELFYLQAQSFTLPMPPSKMQQRTTFIPPFVRDVIYFDKNCCQTLVFSTSTDNTEPQSPVEYISDDGIIILGMMQACLPQAVLHSHIPIASQPEDFHYFQKSCVAVLSKLGQIAQSTSKVGDGSIGSFSVKGLVDLYDVKGLEPWLGNSGKRATEVWFDLFARGEYDQAWLIGSTVLEQLIVNTLLGSPLTLNIRNLLWHGFITPGDRIPLDAYGAMLIVTTMSIAVGLRTSDAGLKDGLESRYGAIPRNKFYFDQRSMSRNKDSDSTSINSVHLTTKTGGLENFDVEYERLAFGGYGKLPLLMLELEGRGQGEQGAQEELYLVLRAIVQKSSFVTIGTIEQWVSALRHLGPTPCATLVNEVTIATATTTGTAAALAVPTPTSSSFMFIMASLPLLEHSLRLMYVRLNGCKEDRTSALIAGEYYLTLDVILDKFVPPEYYEPNADVLQGYRTDEIPNRLYSELGPQAMNLLQDLFLAALGPRLRDRTSHGELNGYFMTDIRTAPWFEYYLGLVVFFLTLDLTAVPERYKSLAEGVQKWVEGYSERRFDEWPAVRKETVRAFCGLFEYPEAISQYHVDGSGCGGGADTVVNEGAGSWIDLRLKPESSVVFANEKIFDLGTKNATLQEQMQACHSAWPNRTLSQSLPQTLPHISNGDPNIANRNSGDVQGMASNLSAWLLIVQSIQTATDKVTTKMATFLELQSQRQLSSRSRKQLEAMRPLVPGWLGMLAGCLALVERFVLVEGQSLEKSGSVGCTRNSSNSNGKGETDSDNSEPSGIGNKNKNKDKKASGTVLDRSSVAEIQLRLAMVNFLNKFVSNFERVKLPMIEAAWLDLVKAVSPLL